MHSMNLLLNSLAAANPTAPLHELLATVLAPPSVQSSLQSIFAMRQPLTHHFTPSKAVLCTSMPDGHIPHV